MIFKEWLQDSNQISYQIQSFLKGIKQNTKVSLENQRVFINFPKYNSLSEADENSPHHHDKGWKAYRALGSLVDPVKDLNWSAQQQYRFKSNLTYAVQRIASTLGLLFEAKVFIFIRDLGFHDGDQDVMTVADHIKRYESIISTKVGTALQQILQMVDVHAQDLAKQIISRSRKLLQCADMVWFNGGLANDSMRTDPADIIIGCSESSEKLGHSIKFTSETRISLANLGVPATISLLAGGPSLKYERMVKNVEAMSNTSKELGAMLSDVLDEIASSRYVNNPKRFVNLLNYLITGNQSTLPAVRNYTSTELGGADWSENFQKDFIITNRPGKPLKSRPEAIVEVMKTAVYMKMTYKVNQGSYFGTVLYFIPKAGNIDIKITNLTSSR